ncbi:hypothetical protein SDC9_157771 [bioreactor metagenome]|uniref:Uncharacterized protein n=1 Tax=bioreactor metagenome TaxID=1076179 RepID=A0A645FA31_9ZZZZ
MIHIDGEDQSSGAASHFLGFFFVRTVSGVFFHHGPECLDPFVAGADADPSERNGASEIGGVLGTDDGILIDDGETDFRVAGNGIELMASRRRMEVDAVIVIDIADRHTVGVAVIAVTGQDAVGASGKNSVGRLRGQELARSAHGSKHELPPRVNLFKC